jgi:hypothetical protein
MPQGPPLTAEIWISLGSIFPNSGSIRKMTGPDISEQSGGPRRCLISRLICTFRGIAPRPAPGHLPVNFVQLNLPAKDFCPASEEGGVWLEQGETGKN